MNDVLENMVYPGWFTKFYDIIYFAEYESDETQNPHDRILFRQFINHLITLSVHLYHDEYT